MVIALGVAACSSGGAVVTAEAPPPALADPDRVRFVAVGDTGKGNPVQQRVAAAMARTCAELGCDLVLLLGDNLYPSGFSSPDDPRADEWIAAPYTSIAPVYAVLGNHDWNDRDDERAQWALDWARRTERFELPALAWSMDAGPATFAALDTNTIFQRGGGPQAAWLAGVLDRSDQPWKLVLGHHPFRSEGPHGNAGAYEGWRGVPWVSGRSLELLFRDTLCGRADLYLAGHDHDRQLLDACGTDLVVSGAGAATTPLVGRGNTPRFASDQPGFVWVELGPSEGELRFYGELGQLDATFPLTP